MEKIINNITFDIFEEIFIYVNINKIEIILNCVKIDKNADQNNDNQNADKYKIDNFNYKQYILD